MRHLLIVRLGSLGDLVHTLPAVAALRNTFPSARIDWIVDATERPFLDLVPVIADRLVWRATPAGLSTLRELRRHEYDAVFDFQGLVKSAVLARLAGARRTIGFERAHLREPAARVFYTETRQVGSARHVIEKNLALVQPETGNVARPWVFPLRSTTEGGSHTDARAAVGDARFALLNPGASWGTKRWAPERFGAIAAHLMDVHHLRSIVLWGPGEQPRAEAVVRAAAGHAVLAPPTSLSDLIDLCQAAALMVSGDTGPLQIAGAVGTPLVAIFGPTDPARNGPWSPDEVTVSRFQECDCHYQRRCRRRGAERCLDSVTPAEVCAAIDGRLRV